VNRLMYLIPTLFWIYIGEFDIFESGSVWNWLCQFVEKS
jgi:hypothetical protein